MCVIVKAHNIKPFYEQAYLKDKDLPQTNLRNLYHTNKSH